MTLLGAPLQLLLASGGVIAAALVGLYLLRPQRRRVDVPYLRLWGLVAQEARSTALARRLRRWESLLLQLVIAALVLLALAHPHLGGRADRPRHVFLVDTSASMQARDVPGGPTRIERARQALEQSIHNLDPEEEALIVGFDARPRPLSSLTSDEAELRAAARALAASDAPDRVVPALRLAADALAGAGRARLTLISDGALDTDRLSSLPIGDGPDALPLGGVELRYVAVGPRPRPEPTSDNLALTAFSVRRYPANPSAYEIIVEVRSDADRPRKARLTISQEGETVEESVIELEPRGVVRRRLADLSGEGRRLEAAITVEGGDPLPLDDHAYALLPERARTRVLLVGEGNLYTEGALLLDRAIEVVRKTPAEYAALELASFDAIVFDGYTPPRPATRPAFYLGCEPPGCPFAGKGTIDAPLVTESERSDPIMRWVALKDMNVSRATSYKLEPGDVALASSLGRPIFVAGRRGGQPAIALGFRPSSSDLPLRVAFPVLLVNGLKWLSGHAAEASFAVVTGHPERLAVDGDILHLRSPRGERLALPAREGRAELDAREVGFYSVEGTARLVAANLADPRESAIGARPVTIAGKALAAPPAIERLRPRAALWRWLAILALALILLEWWTFHRRWTV